CLWPSAAKVVVLTWVSPSGSSRFRNKKPSCSHITTHFGAIRTANNSYPDNRFSAYQPPAYRRHRSKEARTIHRGGNDAMNVAREAAANSLAAGNPAVESSSPPFRFYDNRQKYLSFVSTCNEKAAIARRVAQELAHIRPSPPALRIFDA